MSIKFTFLPRAYGNIKKASKRAKPRWIALAGKPLNIPKFNQNGNGEAYQSWNKDQVIAITATNFKWNPDRFLVGERSSLILFSIFFLCLLTFSLIYKKKGPIDILGLNFLYRFNYIKPASL